MTTLPYLIAQHDALCVLYKPSGVCVHPTDQRDGLDLMSWAASELGLNELAPIHRLDAATSGLVLTSSDPEERGRLGALFASGQVDKTYLALVIGHTRPKGNLKRPLSDGRRGKPLDALTRYKRLELLPRSSLLEVRPKTGRKHQIRRHLHGIGHPVVGDTRYRLRRFVSVPAFPGRLWLHATRLALPDGRTFDAPLPPELEAHLDALRSSST